MFSDGNFVKVIRESQYRNRGFMDETQRRVITLEDLVSVLRGKHGPGEFILKGA